MWKLTRPLIWGLRLLLLVSPVKLYSQEFTAPSIEVGAAAVDITPEGKEIHDPLRAKAIVFRQGQEQAALVVCDVISMPGTVSREARSSIAKSLGISFDHISIAATHTHNGAFRDDLAQKIEQAVREALSALRPAVLDSGQIRQEGLAFNRRFLMRDGTVRFNPGYGPDLPAFDGGSPFLNPDIVRPVGPVDPELGVVLCRNKADGKAFASLSSFALHACTCGGVALSADYPFYLEESLRQNFGNSFISVFGAGTCGDINHFDITKPGPQQGHATSAAIGNALGDAVKNHTSELKSIKQPELMIRRRVVQAPLQSYSDMDLAWAKEATENEFKDFPGVGYNQRGFLAGIRASKILALEELSKQGDTLPLDVHAIRLGQDTAIVTLPAEIFVELGLLIKKASPFAHTLVIELANESCRYVPTAKAFGEGGYEVVNSYLAPEGGEMLAEAAIELLREMKQQK